MSKYGVYILVFFIFSNQRLTGQIDSLIHLYMESSTPEEAASVNNKIIDLCSVDFTCMNPFFKAIENLNPDEKIIRTYYILGNHFFRKGSISVSNEIYHIGAKKTEELNNNHKLLFEFYNALSSVYYMMNPVMADSSLYYIDQSERILKVINAAPEAYWKPNYNRYLVYVALKNFEKADEYLIKSYELIKRSTNRMSKGFVLFTLLQVTKDRNKMEEFNKYLDEFIRFKKSGDKPLDINHLGIMELFTDKELARKLLEESLKRTELSDKPQHATDIRRIELAEIYQEKGETDKAIDQYKKLVNDPFIRDRGMPLSNVYYGLYEAYKKKKQPEEAFQWIEKYISLQDSMNNDKFKSQIAEYEVKYQTKEKENNLMKKEIEIQNTRIKLRNTWFAVLIMLVIIVSIGFYYFKKNKFTKQLMAKENEIQKQKMQELEHNYKVLALNSVIEGQETERLRIAQDLHDGLGGLLTTVKAHVQSIQNEISELNNLNVYYKTMKLIDDACIEVRRIAHDMVPFSIKIYGLKGALEDLKESVEARGLPCELEIFNADSIQLNESSANMLYRIIQEVTNNAVKHANATTLFIQLVGHEKGLNVLIEDNGKGFDINQVLQNRGMGLKSIDSRVSYLGGKINYDSSYGHGTTVNIEIPYNKDETNQNV